MPRRRTTRAKDPWDDDPDSHDPFTSSFSAACSSSQPPALPATGSAAPLAARALDAVWPPDADSPDAQALRFAAKRLLAHWPQGDGPPPRTISMAEAELWAAMVKQPFHHAMTCALSQLYVGSPYFITTKPASKQAGGTVALDVAALVRASGQSFPGGDMQVRRKGARL